MTASTSAEDRERRDEREIEREVRQRVVHDTAPSLHVEDGEIAVDVADHRADGARERFRTLPRAHDERHAELGDLAPVLHDGRIEPQARRAIEMHLPYVAAPPHDENRGSFSCPTGSREPNMRRASAR